MSKNTDIALVITKIEEEARKKSDRATTLKNIRFNEEGGMTVEGEVFEPSPRALQDIANLVGPGVSPRYWNKFPTDMWADQANYLLDRYTEQNAPLLVRARQDNGHPVARCVRSGTYGIIDDQDVAGILPKVGKGMEVQSFYQDEDRTHIRLVTPEKYDLGEPIGEMQYGIHIGNSEVGAGFFEVDAVLFRLLCANGMIRRAGVAATFRRKHIHATQELWSKLQLDVEFAAYKISNARDEALTELQHGLAVKVKNPSERIGQLLKAQLQPPAAIKTCQEALSLQPGNTAWHVVQAITAAARSMTPFSRCVELETIAGNYLASCAA